MLNFSNLEEVVKRKGLCFKKLLQDAENELKALCRVPEDFVADVDELDYLSVCYSPNGFHFEICAYTDGYGFWEDEYDCDIEESEFKAFRTLETALKDYWEISLQFFEIAYHARGDFEKEVTMYVKSELTDFNELQEYLQKCDVEIMLLE